MTRKICLCLLFFMVSIHLVSATHIIGGSISYEHLGNYNYKIKLEVLRDCYVGSPDAPFDDPASIGIYDINGGLFVELLVPFTGDDTVSFDGVCIFSQGICVHKAVYEVIQLLPPQDGGFTIAYQRCCRSGIISNLQQPLFTGMTFHTHINPADQNSAPVFKNDFPFAVFTNTSFIYDAGAWDFEGDSLVYELTFPYSGADNINNMPQPPAPPPYDTAFFRSPYSVENMLGGNYALTINPVTGEMKAIPTIAGVFQIAYAVNEYRNGENIGKTFREFAFVVIHPYPNLNFDVSGSVLTQDSIPLDLGKVQLLNRDIETDSLHIYSEQTIGTGATYSFENIPPGVFYIKAIVDTASIYYDMALPTYFRSAAFWYEATPINQCDTSQFYRDIYLIPADTTPGIFPLDGMVTYAGRSIAPVPDLPLLLADNQGHIFQSRITNHEGYFKFENLAIGTYLLYTDLINSPIDNTNPPVIELTGPSTISVYLYNDSLSLQMPTSIEPAAGDENFSIHLHPNPATDNILLEVKARDTKLIRGEVWDLLGHCHYTFSMFTNDPEYISVSNLSPGIYLIKLENSSGSCSQSFVKSQ